MNVDKNTDDLHLKGYSPQAVDFAESLVAVFGKEISAEILARSKARDFMQLPGTTGHIYEPLVKSGYTEFGGFLTLATKERRTRVQFKVDCYDLGNVIEPVSEKIKSAIFHLFMASHLDSVTPQLLNMEQSKDQQYVEQRKQEMFGTGTATIAEYHGEPVSPEQRILTFGEKAVGLSFNPSGDPDVIKIKRAYADIIDFHNEARKKSDSADAKRHHSVAITDAETAQMRAVKAITWKD